MMIEHVAFNVEDPLSMARWYVEHLGFTVKRRIMEPPWTHFLADDSGRMMIEIYGNREIAVPNYRSIDPLVLHLALVSNHVETDIERLEAAGAKLVGEVLHLGNNDVLAMLRDPWGFAIQLVKRGESMVNR